MQIFELAVLCLVITAVMAWINRRVLHLPHAIGVMSAALLASLVALSLDALGLGTLRALDSRLLDSIDFSDVLMQGMLSMLLFAGSLQLDFGAMKAYRWQIGSLALIGTALSTLIIGWGAYLLLPLAGMPLSLGYCLLFGALISPTDPIAVIKVLATTRADPALEVVISGEALFNDGFGVVFFSMALALVTGHELPTATSVVLLFLREAGAGLAFGALLGVTISRLIRGQHNAHEAVLISLAGVLGGYMLASRLGLSGPLAMVAAGLIVGRTRHRAAHPESVPVRLDMFWESLDSILNSVLFVLMGLEVLFVPLNRVTLLAGALVVSLSLVARLLSVGLPVRLLARAFRLMPGAWRVLTWGGLRGGISIALALSLPAGADHDAVFTLTYCVVAFSILAQGLSMDRVVSDALRREAAPAV